MSVYSKHFDDYSRAEKVGTGKYCGSHLDTRPMIGSDELEIDADTVYTYLTIVILNTVHLILSFGEMRDPQELGLHVPRDASLASFSPHKLALGYLCQSSAFDCRQRNGHSIILYSKFELDITQRPARDRDRHLIFFRVMRKRLVSFFFVSRRLRSALPEINIRH